ncbi:MAG TPA: SDR family oxidoreductase [Microbacteriaceae bacterium]|nr:SDR family oxidoreductase [Microbacteriaceae bacterium]
MKEVVDQGVAELGRLDIIAANAGIDLVVPWDGATEENVQTTIEVNLIGVWKTVMAGVQHLIDSGGGSIILTSSANGLRAFPFNVPYTMAKFGVTGLAKALAMELAKHNIRVNSVHPGGVNTPLVETAWPQFEALKEGNEALFAALEVAAFKPGMMDPREISNAILWLASDESTWVTGHALTVDGGATQH